MRQFFHLFAEAMFLAGIFYLGGVLVWMGIIKLIEGFHDRRRKQSFKNREELSEFKKLRPISGDSTQFISEDRGGR